MNWRKVVSQLVVATLVCGIVGSSNGLNVSATSTVVDTTTPIHVNPIENMDEEFMKGADVSMLYEIEAQGGTYKNDNNQIEDCLVILKDHGVNWVRLRLWNNPYDVSWTASMTENGQAVTGAVGGGTNDLTRTIAIAKRAKALGLKVLLDFHYSDFWADPGKQYKPQDWVGLSGAELESALYNYTKTTLETMDTQNCLPDMVQVGNEINSGMVFDDGKGVTSAGCLGLLKQGTQAVRDVATAKGKTIQIMLHLAEGGDNNKFRTAFDAITATNISYDIIGASFYPYWHGSLTSLKNNLNDISNRYNKKVIVAETAYGYTVDNYDDCGNNFDAAMEAKGGYEGTVQGQATAIRDIMEVVSQVPNDLGAGIFYWEPDWIPVEGTGWITGAGSGWENQAMFDQNGKALPSLDVFQLVSDVNNTVLTPTIKSVAPIALTVEVGNALTLPATVPVTLSNGAYKNVTATWESFDSALLEIAGKFTVSGVVDQYPIVAKVVVKGAKNLLVNGGFEDENTNGWTISSTGTNPSKIGTSDVRTGTSAFNYWLDSDFNVNTTQTLENLPDGRYNFSIWIMGESKGVSDMTLTATVGETVQSVKMTVTGWNNWKQYTIKDINVTGGSCTLGWNINEISGSWGWMDDAAFVRDQSKVVLNVPDSIEAGKTFTVPVALTGFLDALYASEMTVTYDTNQFELVSVNTPDANNKIMKKVVSEGTIKTTIAHTKGASSEDDLLLLTFKAKSISGRQVGHISVSAFKGATAPAGVFVMKNPLPQETLIVQGTTEGGGATTSSNPSATTTSSITSAALGTTVMVSKQEAITTLKPEALQNSHNGDSFELDLPFAQISLPANMLHGMEIGQNQVVELAVKQVAPKDLGFSEALLDQLQLGNHPIIELKLEMKNNGKTEELSWKNETASVGIRMPYIPTAEEALHPENIVVYYLDGKGQLQVVPNGYYDVKTSEIVFNVNHFSHYTIGYSQIILPQLLSNQWAHTALAKCVATGLISQSAAVSQNNQFVSRGAFSNLLVKAFGLNGTLESIGLVKGYGVMDYQFDKTITREEAFTLLGRVLDYRMGQALALESSTRSNNTSSTNHVLASYSDVKAISLFAVDSIVHLKNEAIVVGQSSSRNGLILNPHGELTLAQAATLLDRALKNLNESKSER